MTLTAGVPRWVLVAGSLGTTPGPLAFFALDQRLTDCPGRPKRMAAAVPLTVVGVGIAWRMSRAVLSGLVRRGGSRAPAYSAPRNSTSTTRHSTSAAAAPNVVALR